MIAVRILALLALAFLGEDEAQRRARVLEVLGRDAAVFDAAAAARELAEPGLVPELVELLAARGVPSSWGTGDGPPARLASERLATVEGAVELLPLAALRAEAVRRASIGPDPAVSSLLIARLGERGDSGDLSVVADLARAGAGRVAPGTHTRELERAFTAIAARDPRAPPQLVRVFDSLPGSLRPSVVGALVETRTRPALEGLGSLLELDAGLDAGLLWAIVRLASALGPPHDPGLLVRVRSFLGSGDDGRFQAAVHACGALRDTAAIPLLVEALERQDEAGRRAVEQTLAGLTGLSLTDAVAWERWLEREQRWWDDAAPELLDELASSEPERVVRAMSKSAGHPLHPELLARSLVACLSRREPELVSLACERLGQLGSFEALPGLIECLDHPSERVRAAAWNALRSITRKDLPAQPEVWRALP
jgi:HEAT repeat protein